MRFITASLASLFLCAFFISPASISAAEKVRITEPFVNVYEQLDPKSNVVKMVKKGDDVDLIFAGTSWYNVQIGTKSGWIERKAGYITEEKGIVSLLKSLGIVVLVVVVLMGTFYMVTNYSRKEKTT